MRQQCHGYTSTPRSAAGEVTRERDVRVALLKSVTLYGGSLPDVQAGHPQAVAAALCRAVVVVRCLVAC